jgi:hypothetical protein
MIEEPSAADWHPTADVPLATAEPILFSADSHVVEPADLWDRSLNPSLLAVLPPRPIWKSNKPGGTDPLERPAMMAADGLCGDILYPTLALHRFATQAPLAQQAAFALHNDWIAAYRQAAPERRFGVACLSAHDIHAAVSELERGRAGLARAGRSVQPLSALPKVRIRLRHPTSRHRLDRDRQNAPRIHRPRNERHEAEGRKRNTFRPKTPLRGMSDFSHCQQTNRGTKGV